MSDKKKLIAAAVMNIIIFLSTTGIMISYFLGNEGEYHILPMQRFWLFTTDSNILCAVTSLIAAISEMRILLGKSEKIPAAAAVLKYMGTVAVLLTFTVVMCFLGPTMGYVEMLFSGTSVYMHLLGPVMAFVSLVFFENGIVLKKRMIPLGALSVFIYGIVYVTMVIFIGEANGGWMDYYGFNIGGFWYISFATITLVSVGIAAIVRLAYNRSGKKKTGK